MKANHFTLTRAAGLLAGALLALGTVRAAEADAFPVFDNNYVKLAAQIPNIDGSRAAFQARSHQSKDGAIGIEDLSYGYDLSKDVNLQMDGRLLAGAGDYLLGFKLTKNEVGSAEVGYKRFRTYYDDIGGFFPLNNQWLPIYHRATYVDRGNLYVNATLALPKAPVVTVKYSNQTRSGVKDSTIWGDSDLTGIPIWSQSSLNPISANRKIVPAYVRLSERLETWEASIRHTVGNTTAVLSVGGDRINNRDTRTINRYPGELKPYPLIPSSPLSQIPNNVNSTPNLGADIQGFKESATTVGGRIETVVNDNVTVFAGLDVRHASVSIDASRLITAPIATATGVQNLIGGYYPQSATSYSRPPYSYTSSGSLKQDIVTGNVGVQLKPMPTLNVQLALRGESYKDSGNNDSTYVSNLVVLTTGAVTPILVSSPQVLDNKEKPWTPAIDVRYTGLPNIALYGSWEYRTVSQDEVTNYGAFSVSTTTGALSNVSTLNSDHITEHHSNVKVGANWTPAGPVTLRAELFTKDHENRFEGFGSSAGSYYILNYDIYGAKLTGILKPRPELAFTTRYIIQRGKANISEDGFQKGDSNDARRHQLSETIDWNPSKTVYIQANGSLVYDSIATAYPYVSGTAALVIRNAANNYWNSDVIVGTAIDKDTDLQLRATYYRADNFEPALAAATQPYGAGVKEYTVSAGLKYKLDAKTVISGKLGYVESHNDTTGGFTNFRGPLAYLSIEHAF